MSDKPIELLKRYAFKDSHGHPLENCVEYIRIFEEIGSLQSENEALKADNTRLRKALEFYANDDSWTPLYYGLRSSPSRISRDQGCIAESALNELEEQT